MCPRFLPQQGTETARIGESQHAARIKRDVEMIMPERRHALWQNAKTARHAQMHQRTACRGMRQVLGTARDALDPLPRQPGTDFIRDRPAQIRAPQNDAPDQVAFQVRRDSAACGFDFGKFRHARRA